MHLHRRGLGRLGLLAAALCAAAGLRAGTPVPTPTPSGMFGSLTKSAYNVFDAFGGTMAATSLKVRQSGGVPVQAIKRSNTIDDGANSIIWGGFLLRDYTSTFTATPTRTASPSPTFTPTRTASPTPSFTRTATPSCTVTPSFSATASPTFTRTASPSATASATPTHTTTPIPTASGTNNGTGLCGEYYDDLNFQSFAGSNPTDLPDYDWGNTSLGYGMGKDWFTVEWRGQVEIPYDGYYTFSTLSDDGVELFVDGVQVISDWVPHAATTPVVGTPIYLTAGARAPIDLKFFENQSQAVIHLYWQHAYFSQQVPPITRLYNSGGCGTTPTFTSTISRTITQTRTSTSTPTVTGTRTATRTPTSTRTPTVTRTPTNTRSVTPTGTFTRTATSTRTSTITTTFSFTRTVTSTPTLTSSPTATPTVTPFGSLSLLKSVDRLSIPATAGERLTYVLALTNNGGLVASGASVWDTLPPSTTFLSGSPAPILASNVLSWSGFGPVGSGVTVQFTYSLSYSALPVATGLANQAAAICNQAPQTDSNHVDVAVGGAAFTPTSTGTPTDTPSSSATPTQTSTFTATGTATSTATPTASETGSNTETPSATETPSHTATVTDVETFTQTPTSTETDLPTDTATYTETPSASPTDTPVDSPTQSPTLTATRTAEVPDSDTASPTASMSPTQTPTASQTPSFSSTFTSSSSPTMTPTDTPTATITPTYTATSTVTPTFSETLSSTVSPSATPTSTVTGSFTQTPTATPSPTFTPTFTASSTASSSATSTISPTDTFTATISPSPSATGTPSITGSSTSTATRSPTVTPTGTATRTSTATVTPQAPSLVLSLPPAPAFPGDDANAQLILDNTGGVGDVQGAQVFAELPYGLAFNGPGPLEPEGYPGNDRWQDTTTTAVLRRGPLVVPAGASLAVALDLALQYNTAGQALTVRVSVVPTGLGVPVTGTLIINAQTGIAPTRSITPTFSHSPTQSVTPLPSSTPTYTPFAGSPTHTSTITPTYTVTPQGPVLSVQLALASDPAKFFVGQSVSFTVQFNNASYGAQVSGVEIYAMRDTGSANAFTEVDPNFPTQAGASISEWNWVDPGNIPASEWRFGPYPNVFTNFVSPKEGLHFRLLGPAAGQNIVTLVHLRIGGVSTGVSATVNVPVPLFTPTVPQTSTVTPTPIVKEGQVAAYPQPASDRVCFDYFAPAGGGSEVLFEIYNIAFQHVARMKDVAIPGRPQTSCIDTSQLAPGLYVVKASQGTYQFPPFKFGIIR